MCAVVAIDSVVVAVAELGVRVAGLNAQLACAGKPLHLKLIGLVNEPCGVTDNVKMLD